MAECEEKSLEELESEITCPICQEHYTEPKVLPCLHYYCKKCILKLTLRTQSGKSFHCPECRCKATLPEGGVDSLITAFFANRLKSKVITLQRAHGKVEVKCELCTTSSNAEAFCRQCTRFICKECVLIHTKLKTFVSHEVASLEDLKHGRAKLTVDDPPTEMCTIHKQPFIIFCSDCETLICQHCTLKNHLGHNYEFTNVAAPGVKTKLLEDAQSLKNLNKEFTDAVEKIRSTMLEVETQKESAINNLHTSFKELHNILERREQELVEDTTTTAQQKLQQLLQQEKTLSLASAELQSVVDYTERCVSLSTDNELVSMDTEIMKTIQQKIQEHSKSERSLEPVEEADMAMEVTCAETLRQLCLTQANITPAAVDPAKCTVILTASADVGKPYVGTLTTRLSNGKSNNRKCKVTCYMKSLYYGAITNCGIVKDGPGKYNIQYTPTFRGHNEVILLINGQQVAGSPFPVYVSIHPTQLGKPINIWNKISRPSGITANSKGDILVSSSANSPTLVKFSIEGNRVVVMDSDLIEPRCVACDDEDNIYCVDRCSDKILTCTSDGGNVRLRSLALEKNSPGRCALTIVNNRLHISEKDHPGVVKVYDKELTLLSTIKHSNMFVCGIAADAHRNLYMSDRNSSCIQVFSNYGVFLRSFGHDQEELNYPYGLCVHGQYVYVTDIASHCVFVFTTDGEYVTSFGQQGQKEGDFTVPCHIYVDNSNFVYVVDAYNGRIQCF